jgi:hypothetical protein
MRRTDVDAATSLSRSLSVAEAKRKASVKIYKNSDDVPLLSSATTLTVMKDGEVSKNKTMAEKLKENEAATRAQLERAISASSTTTATLLSLRILGSASILHLQHMILSDTRFVTACLSHLLF